MKTNKPEVKIYEPSEKGATIMRKASFRNTGPDRYVLLTDYEALQAECDELRTALAESRANDQQAMRYLNQVREIVGGDDFPDMVRRCEKLRKDAERYKEALARISIQVDGNVRECVRDCVNGQPDVQDIYDYCDEIDSIIDAAMEPPK